MSELHLKDIGPHIGRFSIVLPDEGGVTELRGENGAGKTEALEAIEALTTGRGELNRNRAAPEASVELDGCIARIRQRKTVSGELEFELLAGKFGIDDFVHPGIDKPDRADMHRIKVLASMADANPETVIASMQALVGGKELFESLVPGAKLADCGNDILAIAATVKSTLEKASRLKQDEVDTLLGDAAGMEASIEDIDRTAPHDTAALDAAYVAAAQRNGDVQGRLKRSQEATESQKQARATFAELANRPMQSVPAAEEVVRQAKQKRDLCFKACTEASDAVVAAKKALADAESRLNEKNAEHKAAVEAEKVAADVLKSVQANAAALEALRNSLEAECPMPPSKDEVEQAQAAVDAARAAIERGGIVRQAIKTAADAAAKREQAKTVAVEAHRLRDASKAVEDVVTEFVHNLGISEITIRDGRLWAGEKLFDELSEGERYGIIIPVAAQMLRKKGNRRAILVISQEAWASLQPKRKWAIHKLAVQHRINIVTAVCTDDPPKPGLVYVNYGEAVENKPALA